MKYSKFPKPMGYETIKTHNGEEYTLNEVLEAKTSLDEIMNSSYEFVSNDNRAINEDNILYYVILYESNRYSDFIQPKNILDFFSHIKNLYYSTSNDTEKLVLSCEEFNSLNKTLFKNINIFYKDTNIEPCNECTICTEKFKPCSQNIVLDCKHNFHKNCIKKWVTEESATCPICKQDIIT